MLLNMISLLNLTFCGALITTNAFAEQIDIMSEQYGVSARIPDGWLRTEKTFGFTRLDLSCSNIMNEYARITLEIEPIPEGTKLPSGFDIWTLSDRDVIDKLQQGSLIYGEEEMEIDFGKEVIDGMHVIWMISHGKSLEHGLSSIEAHEHVYEGIRNNQFITIRLISEGDYDWFVENQVDFSRFIYSLDFTSGSIGSSTINTGQDIHSKTSFWKALSLSFGEYWLYTMGAIVFFGIVGGLWKKLNKTANDFRAITRKILGSVFFSIALIAGFVVVKTEMRKWYIFRGEPSSSNTSIFWFSLILTIVFIWFGAKVWPKKKNDGDQESTLIKED